MVTIAVVGIRRRKLLAGSIDLDLDRRKNVLLWGASCWEDWDVLAGSRFYLLRSGQEDN